MFLQQTYCLSVISVYEETAGLMVNDPVLRTHKVSYSLFPYCFNSCYLHLLISSIFKQPLSVELGPGILGNIIECIQVFLLFERNI